MWNMYIIIPVSDPETAAAAAAAVETSQRW